MSVQADYLQPKLLGILAFFNMQLLSSSAGEKEKKKMVCVEYNLSGFNVKH